MDFKGKTVLITGAASGMGFLCAQCFGREGGKIVLCDVNQDALNEKCALLKAENIECVGVPTDVRDYVQVCAARDKAVETFGSIDVLINMAGGSAKRILHDSAPTFFETPIEVYEWGLDVNLKGPFYFCHAVMTQMAKQKSGVIVNIGSVTGIEGCATNIDYATAKAGIIGGLTKSLAKAGAPYNVRAVCVSPGPVLTRAAMSNMPTLMGRAAEPQEIVDIILFLASEKASFVTGVNLLADGGRVLADDRIYGHGKKEN